MLIKFTYRTSNDVPIFFVGLLPIQKDHSLALEQGYVLISFTILIGITTTLSADNVIDIIVYFVR